MTEMLFYHLKGQTPEQVLPALLAKIARTRLARRRAGLLG